MVDRIVSWLKFSMIYFTISATSCAFVGIPIFIQIYEYWNFGLNAPTVILITFFSTFVAALLTVGIRMSNGGAVQRRVSAVVLVFLVSIFGIMISLVIGMVFGFLLNWLLAVMSPLDAIIFKFQYGIAVYMDSAFMVTNLPSLPAILSIAVLGSLFGLPLARIGKGSRFVDAWSHQTGRRWMLFWQCGAGALALTVIWTVVSIIAHSFFIQPELTISNLPDSDSALGPLLPYQPTLLELSFNFGMDLLFGSLAVGIVAYVAEQVRQQFG